MRKKVNWERNEIGVGDSVEVNVVDIDENIREGKSRRMSKDLVGLYYLAHIPFVLVLSRCCWLGPVFSIVYRWWTPVKVFSENSIHLLTILFHSSISPPSSWRLMIVWTILNLELFLDLGSGIVPSLTNNYSAFLPSWMRRIMSPPWSTIRSSLGSLPSSSGYIKASRMQFQYYSRISPFQKNTSAYSSCLMTATVWSWVDKILQEHQLILMMRDLRV